MTALKKKNCQGSSGHETSTTSTSVQNGQVFLGELRSDLLLWLLSFTVLGAFRLLMIWLFRDEMQAGHEWGDILLAISRGARFDCMVASYPVLPSLALTLVCLFKDVSRVGRPVRVGAAVLTLGLHLAICGITIGYFKEYHDQFNQWVYGLITDDAHAIARTIWRGYPVLRYVAAFVALWAVGSWLVASLLRRVSLRRPARAKFRSLAAKAIMMLVVGGIFFLAIRGWGIHRTIKQRDLAVTRDPFLNKLVANPYIALRYAILDHRYVSGAGGLSTFLGDRRILDAAKTVFPDAGAWSDLDQLSRRVARGRPGLKPNHIFLIVCESLDGWLLLPEYRALGLADGLVRLATNGISCQAFISAGTATIHATGTLVSGLAEAGVNINYQPASRTPFPTASAPIFKRLGYRTRFIYGGYSWQKADEFCLAQGFDEFQGVPNFKNLPPGATGTWGAFDEYLFDHILREVPADLPSFNIVLTTVNHPPFDCDVFARGFPLRAMPAPFDRDYDGREPMKVFGHKWYTAKCASEFVLAAAKRFPGSIFIITGDHASRHFLNSHPPLFVDRAVPCIIYGPEVLAGLKPPSSMAGSHLDLIRTLVELSAGAGFEYCALGQDLLHPQGLPVGLGAGTVMTPRFLFDVNYPDQAVPLPGQTIPNPPPSFEELRWQYLALHALSWWRIVKGSGLPTGN